MGKYIHKSQEGRGKVKEKKADDNKGPLPVIGANVITSVVPMEEDQEIEICTVSGGFTRGGESNTMRKSYVRQVNYVYEVPYGFDHLDINFSSKNFEGLSSHADDPVVVSEEHTSELQSH